MLKCSRRIASEPGLSKTHQSTFCNVETPRPDVPGSKSHVPHSLSNQVLCSCSARELSEKGQLCLIARAGSRKENEKDWEKTICVYQPDDKSVEGSTCERETKTRNNIFISDMNPVNPEDMTRINRDRRNIFHCLCGRYVSLIYLYYFNMCAMT